MSCFRFFLVLSLITCSISNFASADENGNPVVAATGCNTAFTSIQKVCDLVAAFSGLGKCTITADKCLTASQEIFTGNNIETATPATANKTWNGLGGFGEAYGVTTQCLLRDIADMPNQKITTQANATSPLGDLSAKQEVGFLSFNKDTKVFEGYHRLSACAPVVGCIDAYTQKFKLTPVMKNLKGSGQTVGQYQILSSYSLDLFAEGQAQGLKVELPAIAVNTPYGSISAKPEFGFGRATGFVLAGYDGNTKSLLNTPVGAARTIDTYGRNGGTAVVQASVPAISKGDGIYINSPAGWISQIGLGSRDPNPKNPTWKPTPGVEFSVRPDFDVTKARSAVEKTPNAYLGASVKVAYSPLDILPGALKALCGNKPVSICVKQFDIYAKPMIDTAFTSQFNIAQTESGKWNGKIFPAAQAIPDFRPQNMDQYRQTVISYGSTAMSRFALEAGVDFNLHLHITIPIIDDIDRSLIDVHPKTTVLEKISSNSAQGKMVDAGTQATKYVATKQPFQSYNTFKGPADGTSHIKSCLAKPSATGPMPAEPTYTPGDTTDLLEGIEYPCNICIAYPDVHWTDENGVAQMYPGQAWIHDKVSQAGKPAQVQWSCTKNKGGCFDMCTFDPNTKKLTLVRTAIEMVKSGESPALARLRCQAN